MHFKNLCAPSLSFSRLLQTNQTCQKCLPAKKKREGLGTTNYRARSESIGKFGLQANWVPNQQMPFLTVLNVLKCVHAIFVLSWLSPIILVGHSASDSECDVCAFFFLFFFRPLRHFASLFRPISSSSPPKTFTLSKAKKNPWEWVDGRKEEPSWREDTQRAGPTEDKRRKDLKRPFHRP